MERNCFYSKQKINMKNIFAYLILIALTFQTSAYFAQSECDAKPLKQELYNLLKPDYRYDKSKVTEITVKNVNQGGEIGVPILASERYRLLFNTAGFPTEVKIMIYDKPLDSENRTLLYSNQEELKAGKTTFLYHPNFEIFKFIYVDYIIPPSTDTALIGQKGCVVFLMGYKVG